MNLFIAIGYTALVLIFIWKYIDHLEKKHKESYRRMVGKFHRPPGYHLSEQISERAPELVILAFCFCMAPLFVAVLTKELHFIITWLVIFLVQGFLFWKFMPLIKQQIADKKGMLAEMKVGMALSSSLPHSCSVYHDVQLAEEGRKGSNVDHLIITPQEIYLIDTKYRRATREAESNELFYDGKHIQLGKGGYRSDQDIKSIQSVERQFISYLKREGIAKVDIPIRCVLVYPGWKIDYTTALGSGTKVHVDSTKALINRLTRKHNSTSILEGSTLDRIDQHLEAKNIVRTEKF